MVGAGPTAAAGAGRASRFSSWNRHDGLINGIIACVIWMMESSITRKRNWRVPEKGEKDKENKIMQEALLHFRACVAVLMESEEWLDEDHIFLSEKSRALFKDLRGRIGGLSDHTLERWFGVMSDSDGIDIQCTWRFALLQQPEARPAGAAAASAERAVLYEEEWMSESSD